MRAGRVLSTSVCVCACVHLCAFEGGFQGGVGPLETAGMGHEGGPGGLGSVMEVCAVGCERVVLVRWFARVFRSVCVCGVESVHSRVVVA